MRYKKITIPLFLVGLSLIVFSCNKEEGISACFEVGSDITAGVPTTFNSSCSENAVSFYWEFGDGATSTDEHPAHTYTMAGSYTVSLEVEDADGEMDQASKQITVGEGSVIEHEGYITSDETWAEGLHLITGTVYVDGATLTIEPGAVVMFQSSEDLYIGYNSGHSGATLLANGTAAKPITFTSAASTKAPGDWDAIYFNQYASELSSLDHCIIEFGAGYSQYYGSIAVYEAKVSIKNSIIKDAEYQGITMESESYFSEFSNNEFSEIGLYPIVMYADAVHTIGTGNVYEDGMGISVEGEYVEENVTWLDQGIPYIIDGSVYIEAPTSAELTIEPGVEIQFTDGSDLYVGYNSGTYGVITAIGTTSEPIVFTSSAPEASRSAGDWDAIYIYSGAGNGSKFSYCDFSYGAGYSQYYGMLHVYEAGVSVDNCSFEHAEHCAVILDYEGKFVSCTNNSFASNGSHPLMLYAYSVHTIGAGNDFQTETGIFVEGEYIEVADAHWLKHNAPYIMDGTTYVESPTGATLTLDPGCILKFTESSELYIGYNDYGNLVAQGTAGEEIVFTSAAASGFESPGDWDGIYFSANTGSGSILDHCIVNYGGGYSQYYGNISVYDVGAGRPTIQNCQIMNSESWGIYRDNSSPTMSGNSFSGNALGDVR